MKKKNLMHRIICVCLLFTAFTSCELSPDSLKVTLENESIHVITAYTVESGYINMFEDPTFEFGKSSSDTLNPGETTQIMINVSENGSGSFEIAKVTVTIDDIEYSGEDSYLYYHDGGINSTMTATVYDKYDSTVYISMDTGIFD